MPNQIIIHVDMDAFFAAVEIRDNPALRGKPLVIGALPHQRGVVATCSYEARKYGIHSAMNIKEAYRLCPEGVYMRPDMDKYKNVSKRLHDIWNAYAEKLESVAFDEAYLDVTRRAGNFAGARNIAREIKARTRDELGLSCSVGVAYSKTAAKTASEEKKPNGYFEIPTPEDFVNLVIDRDVRVLYTVGAKTAEKLYGSGIRTVRDIRDNRDIVIELLGKQGLWIAALAFGKDDRPVTPREPENAKSISREVTFQKDVDDFDLLKDILALLAIAVNRRANRVGLYGGGVTLKITYADMQGITRSRAKDGVSDARTIYQTAAELLAGVRRRPVRLIGVGIYNLTNGVTRQMTIFDYLENPGENEGGLDDVLAALGDKYHLDFAGHLDEIVQGGVLHKTIEYMRAHPAKPENRLDSGSAALTRLTD